MAFIFFAVSYGQAPEKINFRGESITMTENIDYFNWDQMPESSRLNNGYTGLIQFHETPGQAVQNLFAERNLELIGYIPHQTYMFYFPEAVSVDFLKDNGVKTILPLEASVKMSESLKAGDFEYWAVDGNNVLVLIEYYDQADSGSIYPALAQNNFVLLQDFKESQTMEISVPVEKLEVLAGLNFVKWVELTSPPAVPDDTRGRALHRSSNLDSQLSTGRHYTGEGVGVLVRDDGFVGPHIDFEGRITNHSSVTGQSHGDGVAGIMAGAGNLIPGYRGMAAGSEVHAVYYQRFFTDVQTLNLINNGEVQITNSSYSDGCNDGYTGTARRVDEQMQNNPSLLHVFSAGNSNNQNCGYGAGTQWGNITGGHKQSKSSIATANVEYWGRIVNSSSRGPATDGRIKPDISANGKDHMSTNENNSYQSFGGTSGAAPGIAGVAAQLYEAYAEINDGDHPPAALIKATLLNTANDAGNEGPDFIYGWGIVNGLRAAKLIEDNRYFSDEIEHEETNTHTIQIPANTKQMRVMVYWNDEPAVAGASPTLVNDLDLLVTDPSSTVHQPWVLDHTANPQNLNAPATRGPDHLNNMEQVLINDPQAGNYEIEISGYNVPFGPQEYFVVYEIITENLTLTYPVGGEHFRPNYPEVIHWDAINTTENFTLEYSVDNGNSWNPITTVTASRNYYEWIVPDEITGKGLIRITSGDYQDVSEANFNIAKIPSVPSIVSVCEESAVVQWTSVAGAEAYDVFVLGEKYMEVQVTTSETSAEIAIEDPYDFWVAVRAKNDTEGWVSERTRARQHRNGITNCTVGIGDNIFENSITMYPNPATGEVFFNLSGSRYDSFNVTVSNSLGQTVAKTELSGQTGSLDLTSYSPGIYFVTIKAGNNSTTKKLIVR